MILDEKLLVFRQEIQTILPQTRIMQEDEIPSRTIFAPRRELQTTLSKQGRLWPDYLERYLEISRDRINTTSQKTPFELLFGHPRKHHFITPRESVTAGILESTENRRMETESVRETDMETPDLDMHELQQEAASVSRVLLKSQLVSGEMNKCTVAKAVRLRRKSN